jgi:hypothetical protein
LSHGTNLNKLLIIRATIVGIFQNKKNPAEARFLYLLLLMIIARQQFRKAIQ